MAKLIAALSASAEISSIESRDMADDLTEENISDLAKRS